MSIGTAIYEACRSQHSNNGSFMQHSGCFDWQQSCKAWGLGPDRFVTHCFQPLLTVCDQRSARGIHNISTVHIIVDLIATDI